MRAHLKARRVGVYRRYRRMHGRGFVRWVRVRLRSTFYAYMGLTFTWRVGDGRGVRPSRERRLYRVCWCEARYEKLRLRDAAASPRRPYLPDAMEVPYAAG